MMVVMALGVSSMNKNMVLASIPHLDTTSYIYLKQIFFIDIFIRGFATKLSEFAHFKHAFYQ